MCKFPTSNHRDRVSSPTPSFSLRAISLDLDHTFTTPGKIIKKILKSNTYQDSRSEFQVEIYLFQRTEKNTSDLPSSAHMRWMKNLDGREPESLNRTCSLFRNTLYRTAHSKMRQSLQSAGPKQLIARQLSDEAKEPRTLKSLMCELLNNAEIAPNLPNMVDSYTMDPGLKLIISKRPWIRHISWKMGSSSEMLDSKMTCESGRHVRFILSANNEYSYRS